MLKPNSFLVIVGTDDTNTTEIQSSDTKVSLQVKDINPFYIRHEAHESGDFGLFFGERKDSETVSFDAPVNGSSITFSVASKN